jgi:hypothetical protein
LISRKGQKVSRLDDKDYVLTRNGIENIFVPVQNLKAKQNDDKTTSK